MEFRVENQCPFADFDDKNILTACFRLHSLEAKLRQSRELGIIAYSYFVLSFVEIPSEHIPGKEITMDFEQSIILLQIYKPR
jgi:hypothetical protein